MLLKRIAEHKIIPLLGCKLLFDRSWYGNPLVENQGDHHFSPESVIKKPNQTEQVSVEGDFTNFLRLSQIEYSEPLNIVIDMTGRDKQYPKEADEHQRIVDQPYGDS